MSFLKCTAKLKIDPSHIFSSELLQSQGFNMLIETICFCDFLYFVHFRAALNIEYFSVEEDAEFETIALPEVVDTHAASICHRCASYRIVELCSFRFESRPGKIYGYIGK